jgi:tRNA threonylcarbamoyladenosine biosynthesis protein TsaB
MTSRVSSQVEPLLAAGAPYGTVLGLETGTPIAALGIVSRGRIVAHLARPTTSHGAALPRAVEEILDAASLKLEDLAAIAVGIGPGSFTGLRIGLSYAKGLAMASGAAIVGVPTLDAIALSAVAGAETLAGRTICAVLDARKGEVYAALYRIMSDGLQKMTDDLVIRFDQLLARVPADVLFAGDAKAQEARSLVGGPPTDGPAAGEAELNLRGAMIAALGGQRLSHQRADNLAALEPLYLRAPDATGKSTNTAGRTGTGREGLWSAGKKSSLSRLQSTTRL